DRRHQRHREGHDPMRREGFTLVELMVAATILVVALLGIAAVLPTADLSLHQAGQISKAVALAQEMIEMIKNDPFSQLQCYNGQTCSSTTGVDTRNTATYPVDTPIPPIPGDAGNFMGGSNVTKWAGDIALYLVTGAGITGGYGTITVSTVATDGTGAPILRKVSVAINWTDAGRPYQVTLQTLASAI
ncbi:MAG: prepilin-type N-terminal cleavage/methylation domain-containing protein, partial [candidate division NC10 bacterium]|nr:prepilin-type N-terminal cleavage/methylation domain-containing protein [candidate division NC10 bacterium]